MGTASKDGDRRDEMGSKSKDSKDESKNADIMNVNSE